MRLRDCLRELNATSGEDYYTIINLSECVSTYKNIVLPLQRRVQANSSHMSHHVQLTIPRIVEFWKLGGNPRN